MAENKTINIKINQNADKAEKSFKSYNKELGNTKKQYDAVLKSGKPFDKQLEDINKIVKETPLNVRDMNKQIQAYQSIALSAGRETPVGRKALEEAAALRDRYIDIQNETKRLADDQRTLEGAMQGVATGVAVYGGIQSAMALSGVESEKLRETLVKLQAAQTLMNSINQVATAFEKESALMLTLKAAKTQAVTVATAAYATVTGTATGAMKLFRIALASTGIGAIVVGLGLLIANFDKVKEAIFSGIDGFKKMGAAMKLLMLPLLPLIATIDLVTKGLQALGIIESEQEKEAKARHQAKMKRYLEESKALSKQSEDIRRASRARQKALDDEIEMLEAQGKKTRHIQRKKLEDNILLAKQEEEIAKKKLLLDARNNSFTLEAQRALVKARAELIEESERKLRVFDAETNTERIANYKNYAKDRRSIARQIEDLENELLEEGIEKELEINRDKFARLIEDTKKNTKLTRQERNRLIELYEEQGQQQAEEIRAKYRQKEIDAERKLQQQLEAEKNAFEDEIANIEEANYQALLTDQERELLAVQDKYFRLETLAEGNAEALNAIEIARLNEENAINLKYQEEQYNNEKAINDKKKADEKALADYRIQVAQQSLTAIADIANLFAKGNEKQQKRAFQVQKAVGIAQATINTAQAITKVFAETTDFTPTQSLRIANAVGIGLAGAAQIASIASQQFTGGGDVESPTDIGGGGETVAPSFNVVGDSSVNQLAQLQQQPTQAFVVSGEVTSAQALDRNRVTNATL